jgi:hypothetical protein
MCAHDSTSSDFGGISLGNGCKMRSAKVADKVADEIC